MATKNYAQSRFSIRATLTVAALLLTASAWAQTGPDPADTSYGMGALFPSQGDVAAFPKAEPLRGPRPPRADLSRFMPPVGKQGPQGSCVGWAVGYGLRSYYLNKLDKFDVSLSKNVPSPTYIYGLEAGMRGEPDCLKSGMHIWKALNTLKAGVVSLAQMPYDPGHCPVPTFALQGNANQFRIKQWEYMDPRLMANTIKLKISQGHPVVFGMRLAESFWQYRGGVYTRLPDQSYIGGHAMVIIGYDDKLRAFRIQNSWGTGWGEDGLAWVSYDTFRNDAVDAYVIQPARAGT